MNVKLRDFRESKGLTQVSIAKELNITQQNYSRIESGENPSLYLAKKIADFFNTNINELFFADKNNY